jgi:prophage tail gpP-like protein
VKLGGDLVLTGYIDRYDAAVNAREHVVHISGRSKSADLVDCAAFTGGQGPNEEQYVIPAGSILSIIQALAKPYGITVTSQAGDGPNMPAPMPINLGETAWEIIDRMTKYGAMVAYDMPDGSLMLAQAGNEQMASGFTQGVNVEQAEVNFTMDQRFSVYEGFQTATPILSLGGGGNMPPQAIEHDEGVPRFRKRIIVSEQPTPDGPLVQKRVTWEMNRRLGRSQAVNVTCDSWRDTSGNLWAPNHLASVSIPSVKIPNVSWVIGQVVYQKDERGRHAIVLLMPKGAFLPEPLAMPGAYPTAQSAGIGGNNPASQSPPDAPPAQTPLQPTGSYSVGGAAGAWNLGKP